MMTKHSAQESPSSPTPGVTRRDFLKRTGAAGVGLGAAAALPGCGSSNSVQGGPQGLVPTDQVFAHGIASGDPLTDRVMLWTRPTGPVGAVEIPVRWEMAADPEFDTLVASGSGVATAATDFTFKVDVTGLQAGTTYYYRFESLGQQSRIGRTKTLASGSPDDVKFAIVSCASFPHGFFNAYGRLAERPDLDFVLCLGDYIYEYGNQPGEYGSDVQAGGRIYEPNHEMVTLDDYRVRHALYKRDANLQELHRQYAMINVWDDHESTNDSHFDGAENHQPDNAYDPANPELTEGEWFPRKNRAIQAYYEWLPIRQGNPNNQEQIYRTFRVGDLAEVVMLDTRLIGRDEPPEPNGAPIANTGFSSFTDTGEVAEDRSLMGAEQLQFLEDRLTAGDAPTWKFLGQQIMFGQLKLTGRPNATNLLNMGGQGGDFINPDQWDGYPRERERVWEIIRGGMDAPNVAVDNVVVLTGDIHTSWAMDITEDTNNLAAYNPQTGAGSMAVEFVATSVTSPGLDQLTGTGEPGLMTQNPHMKYIDFAEHGYVIVTADANGCQGDWYFVDDILVEGGGESFATGWRTGVGENHLTEATTPVAERANPPAFAP